MESNSTEMQNVWRKPLKMRLGNNQVYMVKEFNNKARNLGFVLWDRKDIENLFGWKGQD